MVKKNSSSRTIKAKRNIMYGFLQIIVSQALPFVVRTILIYRFGVDYLGLNSLFASILSVLSLTELGFGTAVVFSMYKPFAKDECIELIIAMKEEYKGKNFGSITTGMMNVKEIQKMYQKILSSKK